MLKLAFRNLSRNLRRLRPMIIVLGLSFFILFLANSVLEFIDTNFSTAYIDNISGQAGIGQQSDENFTLFGADSLLVGDYLVPPVLDDYTALETAISEDTAVADHTSVVVSAARVDIGGLKNSQLLFGVDFDDYRRFFPDLQLVAGSFPSAGQPGILIQEDRYRALTRSLGEDVLGQPGVLTAAYESTFTIREVPVVGVFRYPVSDEMLNRVALVDADTARALNGFVYGATEQADLGATEQSLLDASLDDLFAAPAPDATQSDSGQADGAETGAGTDAAGAAAAGTDAAGADTVSTSEDGGGTSLFDSLDSLFATPADGTDNGGATADSGAADSSAGDGGLTSAAVASVSDAWNFMLLRFDDGYSLKQGMKSVQAALPASGDYVLKDWRRSIGGTVLLVWFIRIILNAGIVFVIFGASAVTLNAIVLSVLERAKEIGTMRAIGATRFKVAVLLSIEIIVIISGTAFAGIIAGVLATAVLNATSPVIDNQYISLLFGGQPIQALVNPGLVLVHLAAAILLAAAALIYPLRKILGMSPVRAMM